MICRLVSRTARRLLRIALRHYTSTPAAPKSDQEIARAGLKHMPLDTERQRRDYTLASDYANDIPVKEIAINRGWSESTVNRAIRHAKQMAARDGE